MSIPLRFPKPDEPVAFMYPSTLSRLSPDQTLSARKEAESTPLVQRRGRYRLFAVKLANGEIGVVYSAGNALPDTRAMVAFRLQNETWVEE